MLEFIRKMTEWILKKEEEAARKCAIPLDQIEKQIKVIEEKKNILKKDCEKNIKELENLQNRLEKIKSIELLRCQKD